MACNELTYYDVRVDAGLLFSNIFNINSLFNFRYSVLCLGKACEEVDLLGQELLDYQVWLAFLCYFSMCLSLNWSMLPIGGLVGYDVDMIQQFDLLAKN